MAKPTRLTELSVRNARLGGVPITNKGGQPLWPGRVPSNWYPVNQPSASNGTPSNADCQTLLNTLAPLVAKLTIDQSLMLPLVYRTVQPGVTPASNTFTVNGQSATATSLFDGDWNLSETVPVDVINKNPALAFDLALRLAAQTANRID